MEIKCERCGAPMRYDLTRRLLVCDYCNFTKSYDDNKEVDALGFGRGVKGKRISEVSDPGKFFWLNETIQASCPSCGAELVGTKESMSHVCPYCKNAVITLENSEVRGQTPQAIIPFRLDRTGLEEALRLPIGNNTMVPNNFRHANTAADLDPVFVPVWVIDTKAEVAFAGKYRTSGLFSSVKETHGHYRREYNNLMVCGTRRHGLDRVDITEQYILGECESFLPEYLAGFPAEWPQIGLEEAVEAAKEKAGSGLQEEITTQIRNHFKTEKVENVTVKITFSDITGKLVLLPVWVKENVFEGKIYPVMVNGQTGSFMGDYPSSVANIGSGIFDVFGGKKQQ